jgi:isoleucyl-tRNA synthetase
MSISFPSEEERILKQWKEIDAFRRQVELSKGRKPFSFYDGPPFATGLPHYGHLLASTIKDIIPRYWSMNGRYVERRFGWDTHGVPVEHIVDKKLGISGKDAVMKMGVAKYNEECRSIVMEYAGEWQKTIERLGRWVDFENDYKVRRKLQHENEEYGLMNVRQWTSHLWSLNGGPSSECGRRMRSIVDIESCHIQLLWPHH